jgi:hypothetical protein
MSTLVLCPSRDRPAAAAATLESFLATRADTGSRLVFVVDRDDPRRRSYPGEVRIVRGGSLGLALREVATDTDLLVDATSVGMIGDDCRFRTPGWDVALDGWLQKNVGVAWPDDGWAHPWSATAKAAHWWLSRPVVDAMGLCPPTRHFYMDDFWATVAREAGCARYMPEVLVEHLHPMAGKADNDRTYARTRRFVAHDRRWWQNWQASGKAADVARLRGLVRREQLQTVRVLADWHHPALWESLSILFEDRFGWRLYAPAGPEWKGVWAFQGGTPGWTADDYLAAPGAIDRGEHAELTEVEYPGRPRKVVSVEQFEALTWDYVVASVGAHQRTFSNLAQRRGARYVHHIGDARRRREHIRQQVVLASPPNIHGALRHHQEFDMRLFAPGEPHDHAHVASFMLRMRQTSGPWRWLADAPGIGWSAVECDTMRGPGYVAPMARVADMMRAAGWVWHDKAGYMGSQPGDGYGHVLFTAAAMGRPLIGHASYYKGQAGETFWRDGETCIDLDRHTADEAVGLVLRYSGDPAAWAELSSSIRDRFLAEVDFDAEAEAIYEALT